ncbi:tripartite tricarboxylate transporter permease [Orrella sp. 11846]|uniref:tripartite tricarboxylate transporter permease n=1 Tax=Orrella sp. 11846 TaxID=3409913 RepID=UPI003B5CF6E4
MFDFASIFDGLSLLTDSWHPWSLVIPGLIIGLVMGVIPGMQTSMAMAIFLPLTFTLDFLTAILFLTAIFTGGMFGGGITAILMNIPGTSSAVATTFDGYPMTKKGLHNEALGISLVASCIGAFIGYLILMLLIQPLTGIVLGLGPTEMFVVILWGMTLIATLSGDYMLRSLMIGVVGLLVGTIGMSATGVIRGTFDNPHLLDGVAIIPAMIGMFAASELFSVPKEDAGADKQFKLVNIRAVMRGGLQALKMPGLIIRGSLFGTLIGAIPGIGSSVANLVSYGDAKRRSQDPDSFGQGNPAGVAASESANSSSEGGGMVSLFALGIPGGAGTAILLAAFSVHNVTGGPRFMAEHADVIYAIIIANLAQALLLLVVGVFLLPMMASIVRVPRSVLGPSVIVLATFGSYGITGDMVGPITLVIFSAIGWVLRKYHYSVAAAVIGMLLGGMAESELLRSVQISGAKFSFLLGRPITLSLLGLLVLSVIWPIVRKRWKNKKLAAQA